MGDIDHIHRFDLRGKFLLPPCVRWARLFVVVLAGRPFPLVFGVELAGLFKHPTVFVGVIGRFIGGAMNLEGLIKYSVQTGWTIFVSFEWILPLTGFGATESGVDRRVFIIVSTLVLVASWLAIVVPGFRGAWVDGAIASTS